jgi:hypothetical protein
MATMDAELIDARAGKLNEDYIYEWSIFELITNSLVVMLCSYIGGLFVMLFIALQFNINVVQYFSFFTYYIVPIIFMIIMVLRKKIINLLINKANRNEDLGSLYNHQRTSFIPQLFLFGYLLIIIYLNKMYSNIITDNSLVLISSVAILFMPIYYTFGTILTEAGCVFIEFNEFSINLYNFDKRQRWLTKICERISNIFKKGNIMVNKDELRSEFNLQMKNSVDMTSKINEMKNWFLSENKNDDIFSIFEKIWPNVKKKTYIRKTWYEYIELLPPYQYVICIIVIISLILDPSLINDIMKQLMDKLL